MSMVARQHHENAKLDVIMVTYDNPLYLGAAMKSILATWAWYPFRLIVVNNGAPQNVPPVAPDSQAQVVVLNQSSNLGWEGGLKVGLEYSEAPLVGLAHDDIRTSRPSRLTHRLKSLCSTSRPISAGKAVLKSGLNTAMPPLWCSPTTILSCPMRHGTGLAICCGLCGTPGFAPLAPPATLSRGSRTSPCSRRINSSRSPISSGSSCWDGDRRSTRSVGLTVGCRAVTTSISRYGSVRPATR